jgi:hypothetical protein
LKYIGINPHNTKALIPKIQPEVSVFVYIENSYILIHEGS